ncbi:MAG: DUF3501 family protein [Gammaproteobacteria bacterium]|jgi:hypothetical protein|nr:DUF3501 family protein [Gammaproteobacteria bacterium]MBT4586366.1 DUF3501 family protein [Gammaproteobacteria bacterium]MBT5548328.1 DUF3501 family protein [Gammaproteobacteria bacterium]MBT5979183.1 DUF3501 family protein [Gammaproteobacteria bacterium]MBT6634289.1 DUF3501 family protein [Gammaproteobacteria bacterium]
MLTRQDLLSLEEYAEQRSAIRSDTIQTKKLREVNLGEHLRILFENKKTVQFQIQEMLRIEKIFEADGIQEELDVYNSLVPEGSNLKATMMIEYTNVEERTAALSKLIGVERSIYFQVGNHDKVFAICNEDMDRETEVKTSAVHFMRFEFDQNMMVDFGSKAPVKVGVSHPHYDYEIILNSDTQEALNKDFNNSYFN